MDVSQGKVSRVLNEGAAAVLESLSIVHDAVPDGHVIETWVPSEVPTYWRKTIEELEAKESATLATREGNTVWMPRTVHSWAASEPSLPTIDSDRAATERPGELG